MNSLWNNWADARLHNSPNSFAVSFTVMLVVAVMFRDRLAANSDLLRQMTVFHLPEKVCSIGCRAELPAIVPPAATTTAARSAVGLGTGFVDVQRSPVEFPAVQFRDGAIRVRVGAHLDKTKPSCLTGIAIRDNTDSLDGPVCLEQRAYRIFGGTEAEVSNKNILHFFSLWFN
jgi:hypothetical protein